MRYLYTVLILTLIISLSSCRKDFSTTLSSGSLKFSQDTIFFNRVFDDISSSTHRFTVKNNSNGDITIPTISLGRGNDSFYRLNVDGLDGKSFENIDIQANDSIFVFIEATIDFNAVDADFMYRDEILFDAGSNEQKVALEALVLDVNLIRPDRTQLVGETGFEYEQIFLGQVDDPDNPGTLIDVNVRGTNLEDDTNWSNDKPYLIYNYVGVPAGKTLTIDAGTQLHFHVNSGIIVQNGGRLIVNGTLDEQVVFQGDRLEEFYQDVPGQWGTIWLFEGSVNSEINYAVVHNATIGLLVDSNSDVAQETLSINNSQIYNTTSYGILARNSKITAKNLVVGNNGQSSFSGLLGGTYNFTHATFANYWNNSSRQDPTVFLSSIFENLLNNNLTANFTNCIIDGNQNLEFAFEKDVATNFNYNFKNCMLKFNDNTNQFTDNPLYDFTNINLFENIIREGDAKFKNTNTSEDFTDLRIGENSDARAVADFSIIGADLILQKDILGFDRTNPSDIGAYNFTIFEED